MLLLFLDMCSVFLGDARQRWHAIKALIWLLRRRKWPLDNSGNAQGLESSEVTFS
jgi:hypothetical protein